MPKYVYLYDGDVTVLGPVVETLDEITPKIGTVTACGANGVLFIREDGTFGVENTDEVTITEATSAEEAERLGYAEYGVKVPKRKKAP
jgi:hypothetical protein